MKVTSTPKFAESVVAVPDIHHTLGEVCDALCDGDAQFAAVVRNGDVLGVLGRNELEASDPGIAVAEHLPQSQPLVLFQDVSLDAVAEQFIQRTDLDAIVLVDPTAQPVGVLTRDGVLAALWEERRAASDAGVSDVADTPGHSLVVGEDKLASILAGHIGPDLGNGPRFEPDLAQCAQRCVGAGAADRRNQPE